MSPLPYPVLHATHGGVWIESGGDVRSVSRSEAIAAAAETPMILLNAPVVGARIGHPDLSGLDLLELFAFVHPARFVVPTPKGLAHALDLAPPEGDAETPGFLRTVAESLLGRIEGDWPEREGAWSSAQALARLRWPWAAAVVMRIGKPERAERWLFSRLPEWDEAAQRPPAASIRLPEADTLDRLRRLVGESAEVREGQRAYASAVAPLFGPRAREGRPEMLLAEAGTGIGKTLGYLAPASLWAERAGGSVWVSTYTKALQRQLDAETARIFPDPAERREKVVIRKGRENYLCLLNLEDALQGGFQNRAAILAHLVARWAAYTRDGDMVGGDLPGWLPALFKRNGTTALTDRRGECVYAGCPHYRKCFIERAARASEGADIVIANHALVMLLADRARTLGRGLGHIVFDEGHHLHEAADSTFRVALTGQEAIEMRRWLIGPEGKSRGRRRGLAARLADVVSYDEAGAEALSAVTAAAQNLVGDGWLGRIVERAPFGPIEALLSAVRDTVYARADAADAGYGIETDAAELDGHLVEAATIAAHALEALGGPLVRLRQRLEAVMEDAPDWLDGPARARIEGAINGLILRNRTVGAWVELLLRLGGPPAEQFVDWLAVDRVDGREYDVGIRRHWLDPGKPLAETVLKPAHGLIVTSATLKRGGDWSNAERLTGAQHMEDAPKHFEAASPFDYTANARVLIVTDIKKGDTPQLAIAYARLVEAARGGTLGLFSAISRLKAVHARIADRLARNGLPLYAQHVDPMDTGTLVDIFRDDPHASLLGTDALRDGVDVPGHSLRQVVMEGVPWPRPTVLHAARRAVEGGSRFDDQVVRARLAQAFGRLIRRADDRGVFVLLSAATPSRLLDAFPPGVAVERVTLDQAVEIVRSRLSSADRLGHQDAGQDVNHAFPGTA
ncbi:ATP-dependent DNA helicase [Sphingomonas sp. ID0503]|uniref:ATP-dependent DNA helicase n=1 Tax=Sphingomonas sp. ID0503 TaxID=3399691 RepID=UPI003AFB3B42